MKSKKYKGWVQTALPNAWHNKNKDTYLHAFKAHKNGIPTGYWIVRAGRSDETLLKNQKKFATEILALEYAGKYMKSHPKG